MDGDGGVGGEGGDPPLHHLLTSHGAMVKPSVCTIMPKPRKRGERRGRGGGGGGGQMVMPTL